MQRFAAVLAGLLLAGCGGTATASPTASSTASPSASTAPTMTPVATSTPISASPTPAAPSITIEQHCTATFGPGSPAVVGLGSITPPAPNTAPPVELLDVTNPLAPRQLCTFKGLPWQVRLIGRSELGYSAGLSDGNPADGVIGTFDIPPGSNRTVISWKNGGFGAGTFAWNAAGVLAYIFATAGTNQLTGAGSWELHLVRAGPDRVLTTLPGVPGRGGSYDDDLFLAFSPDGQYLALDETYTATSGAKYWGGGLQVRRVGDGSLIAPPISPATMAVWVGDSLFYRDPAGVHRLEMDGTSRLVMPGLNWFGPRASPDGKWIVYIVMESSGLPHVNVYNLAAGSGFPISALGRAGGWFLSPTVLWEYEQRLCTSSDSCGMSPTTPTGVTYTYDVVSRQETRSVISSMTDVWPRMD